MTFPGPVIAVWYDRWFMQRFGGMMLGTPIGNSAILAVAWCIVIALVGYLLARAIYNHDPVR